MICQKNQESRFWAKKTTPSWICEIIYAENCSLYLQLLLIHSFVGLEKVARMFIEKGANVNAVNDKNDSALILAVWNGKTKFQMNFYRFSLGFPILKR